MPKPRKTSAPLDPRDQLVREMIGTFERLAVCRMARIDARVWARHYALRAARLGIRKETKCN